MRSKNKNKPQSFLKVKARTIFSRKALFVFGIIFALAGSYFVYTSRASDGSISYSGKLTQSAKIKTYDLPVGTGQLRATLNFKQAKPTKNGTVATAILQLRDLSGAIVATKEGVSPLVIDTSVAAGTYSVVVTSNDVLTKQGTTYTLDINFPPVDTQVPLITIQQPASGASVAGDVTLMGAASDDSGVAKVEVQVDTGAFQAVTGTNSWSFMLATAPLTNGSHTLVAKVTDKANKTATTSITLIVNNQVTTPPPPTPVSSAPFTSNSLWNTPIPATAAWWDEPKLRADHWWVNLENYSLPVVYGKSTDPLVKIPAPNSWGWPAQTLYLRIPTGITGAAGTDGSLVIVSEDVVYSFWQFKRSDDTNATVVAWAKAHITNESGWGQSNPTLAAGIRAAGSSLLAGLVTGKDVTSGSINHALAVSLLDSELKHGWVPPAISEDGGSSYTGTIPMGSRLGIPANTPVPAGLSTSGRMMWDAFVKYGAFVTDRHYGTSPVILYADPFSVSAGFVDPLRVYWSGSADLDKIMPYVRVVR